MQFNCESAKSSAVAFGECDNYVDPLADLDCKINCHGFYYLIQPSSNLETNFGAILPRQGVPSPAPI